MEYHPARFFQQKNNGVIQCTLCPRSCVLREGERGYCFGRRNVGGRLVLSTYGRASGFAVDPIEKKPLYHFFPGSSILSFGTMGCNLGCRFCQNWHISKADDETVLALDASPSAIAEKARAMKVPSVAFTYNEPIVFAEYVMDTAQACHELGIRTVAVTAGYISAEARQDFFRHIDAANVDLKSFREDFYRELCAAHLQPVLDTLLYLKRETKVWLEITNLIIPGENDSEDEIREMSAWIVKELGPDVPLHVSAFHPDFEMVGRQRTGMAILRRAREIALAAGLKYVYTGNMRDEEGSTTRCPQCRRDVIQRDVFRIEEYNINNGCCAFCKAVIVGRF